MSIGEKVATRNEVEILRRKLERALSGAGITQHIIIPPVTETFIDLTDTPSTYAGATGELPSVNAAETGLEFNSYITVSPTLPLLTIRNLTDAEVDTVIQFAVGATPVVKYTMGVDDSDADSFKIESGTAFSGNDYIRYLDGTLTLQDSTAGPIFRIINASDAERDPLIQFVLGATPVVKYTMGVDDSDADDAFRIGKGATLETETVLYSGNTNTLFGEGVCSGTGGDPAAMTNSVIIGDEAAPLAAGYWEDNVIIGSQAGYNIRDWYNTSTEDGIWDSVIIGPYAASGVAATLLGINTVIGLGYDVLGGAKGYLQQNIFIGDLAGHNIDTTGQDDGACNNIVLGSSALYSFTPTSDNWGDIVAIGYNALYHYIDDLVDNDSRIISIGSYSFYEMLYGTANVGIGDEVLYGGGTVDVSGGTAGLNYCTSVGAYSGANQDTPADGLCFLGYFAGNDTGRYGYNQGDVIAVGRNALKIIAVSGTPYFTTEKGSIYIGSYSGWDVVNFVPPATGPTGAKAAGAGLEIGNYRYRTSFVLDGKETMLGAASASVITTTAGNLIINVASIPTYTGPRLCTARKLYRSKVGGSLYLPYYFVATIGDNSTVIYADSTPDASLTAVGPSTSYSIALGYGAKVWTAHQCVIGGDSGGYIDDIYLGNGIVNATPLDVTINASGGVGTNIAAADIILAGGRATGDAASGDIIFKTGTVGASGTVLQILAERFKIQAGTAGTITSYPIRLLNVAVPGVVTDSFAAYSADAGGIGGHAAPHWIGEAGGIVSLECGGGTVNEYRYYTDLADDAILTLPFSITSSARGFIAAGNNEERSDFWIDNDGDVTLVNNSTNVVANADTDDKLDIGTGAAQEPLQIKNRLNATKKIFLVIWYN
jgi:hypothetical protein